MRGLFPRGRRATRRYQRHKLWAIVITFVVLWSAWKIMGPDDPADVVARWMSDRDPEELFRERLSGEMVRATAIVEGTLPDSTSDEGRTLTGFVVRTESGHPLRVRVLSNESTSEIVRGDSVLVRGTYRWNTGGGEVRVGTNLDDPGYFRARGSQSDSN